MREPRRPRKSVRLRHVLTALLAVSALLLSSCAAASAPARSHSSDPDFSPPATGAAPSGGSSHSESEEPSSSSASPSPSDTSCPDSAKLPDGVNSAVCGEKPDGARDLKANHLGNAVVQTPSRNIICTIGSETLDCIMNGPYRHAVMDSTGAAHQTDPSEGAPESAPVTVGYDETVSFGRYACVSQKLGMACWNTKNNHGLFLSKKVQRYW